MKTYTHGSWVDQAVQIGDKGGDEYDSLVCTGYHVNYQPGPGFPYVMRRCYIDDMGKWYMPHPTNDGEMVEVPETMEIRPTFEAPEY